MPRLSRDDRAQKLLLERRVLVDLVRGRYVRAVVRGDHGYYEVVHDAGRWMCTCDNPGECSHRVAVMYVTSPLRVERMP